MTRFLQSLHLLSHWTCAAACDVHAIDVIAGWPIRFFSSILIKVTFSPTSAAHLGPAVYTCSFLYHVPKFLASFKRCLFSRSADDPTNSDFADSDSFLATAKVKLIDAVCVPPYVFPSLHIVFLGGSLANFLLCNNFVFFLFSTLV